MQQQQPQVTLEMMKQSKEILCEECGNNTFEEILKLRKLSKLITAQPKDTLIPVPMFACKKCGNINDEFDIGDL